MRKETEELRLNHLNIFSLDRLNTLNNFESGTNITLGFDYKMEKDNKELDFSVGQSINADENSSMPSSSSLDQRFSDIVGNATYKVTDNIDFSYNFAIDQNYSELNYSEIETSLNLNPIKFNLNYLRNVNILEIKNMLKLVLNL